MSLSIKHFLSNLSVRYRTRKSDLEIVREAITVAVARGERFCAFATPFSKCPLFFANTGLSTIAESVFSITPWGAGSSVSINTEENARTYLERVKADDIPYNGIADNSAVPFSTSFIDYERNVSELIDELKATGGKCVISRVDSYNLPNLTAEIIAQAAMNAFAKYKEEFVYIFYTPDTGGWLAASPEKVVEYDQASNIFKTIALGGTRKFRGYEIEWDTKNLEEHEFIVKGITDQLNDAGIEFRIEKRDSQVSGALEHLRTCISGRINPERLPELIGLINPSPAIAGFPRSEALRQINRYERHSRECYAGLVSLSTPSKLTVYANLRCVRFSSKGLAYYAGGGITSKSDVNEEWRETQMKIFSIASCFPQNR